MKLIRKAVAYYRNVHVAAKAAMWFVVCSTLQKCVSLITVPIFTRLMSTVQYGQFTIYISWLQILMIFSTMRLNMAVFNKGMSKYKDARDAYTSTMQTITLVLAGAMLMVYLLFRRPINQLIELPTFIMVAMFLELMFYPAVDFWTVRKRYEYIYRPVVARTLLMTVLNAVLGVIVVLLAEEKGYARILSVAGVNMFFGIVLFIYNFRQGKTFFEKKYAIFAIRFNLPLLIHYISQYVLEQFDRIMIQKMVGIAEAGIYGVAYNAGMIMKIITQSISNAMIPWQYDKLEKRDFQSLNRLSNLIFLFVGGCSLVFSIMAPEIIMILAGRAYQEAIYVVPPVAISVFFVFVYTIFGNVEFFYDRTKFTMYISMIGALVNVVLNYVCIQWFGYIAAAYTTLFCYVLFVLLHYVYMSASVKKVLGVNKLFNTKQVTLICLGVLGGGLVVIALYPYWVIRYLVILVLGAICVWKRKDLLAAVKQMRQPKKE